MEDFPVSLLLHEHPDDTASAPWMPLCKTFSNPDTIDAIRKPLTSTHTLPSLHHPGTVRLGKIRKWKNPASMSC